MLVIALSRIIIGENDFESMEDWGKEREEWFRGFLELPKGIADKDTFRRLFERINPAELLGALTRWLSPVKDGGAREVNIDGKTIGGSGKAGSHEALQVVSAWVGEQNLVLDQVATDEKSNEITAIPRLLDMLDIRGDVVTIDAMGCQTAIAEHIRKRLGDYVLSMKENRPTLYQDIKDYFDDIDEQPGMAAVDCRTGELEKDHGRIERRSVTVVTDVDRLEGKGNRKDLKSIIRYRCRRTIGEQTTITYR
jgi:hypothetical protein